MSNPEIHHFSDDGRFPNSTLPLLVYRAVLPPDPAAMERAFAANGWTNSWRNGIFDYHHFHSITHEVLGIAAGEAQVVFGGPLGEEATVRAGDVLVIGAYPGGSECDVLNGNPAEYAGAVRAIAALPVPDSDPVSGRGGPLPRLWARTDANG